METHRDGLCDVTALSGVNEDNLRLPPRSQDGHEGLLIDYIDDDAVRSRGQDLLSTHAIYIPGNIYKAVRSAGGILRPLRLLRKEK